MRDIVIASANRKAAERVRNILQSDGLMVSNIYASGSEVLAFSSIRPDAVIVCGKISDMTAISLSHMLPFKFDMVWLLPSGQVSPLCASNVITLNMPLDRKEFLKTVRVLASSKAESYERNEKRCQKDDEILTNAKKILMAENHISEKQAHHLIQKKSMDTGMNLILTAKLIGGKS
ncbi:MAG: ANTAR domain-containing protein [Oscillospiraceae bacterium]